MNEHGKKKTGMRPDYENLWDEFAEKNDKDASIKDVLEEAGLTLTREELDWTLDSLQRYTVQPPTQEASRRLLHQLVEADVARYAEELSPCTSEDAVWPRQHLMRIMRTVWTQTRLFGWGFWLVSAFLIVLGGWLGFYQGEGVMNPLAVIVPVLAALSVCAAFRTFGTPMFELEMTLPITPGQLVYGRLVLIVGYDVAIAMAVSPMAAAGRAIPLGSLILDWLLPLGASSLAALAAVLYMRPFGAAAVSLAVWALILVMDRLTQVSLLRSVGTPLPDGSSSGFAIGSLLVSIVLIQMRVIRLRRGEGSQA